MKSKARWLVAAVSSLSACGAGPAAIVLGRDTGSGGSGNSLPVIGAFQVATPKTSPARIQFTLADRESDPTRVDLFARVAGHDQRLTQVPDLQASSTLATSPQGIGYDMTWDFPAESFLPDDARLVADVVVFARLDGAAQVLVDGGNSIRVSMGNDPPAVLSIDRIDVDPDGNQAVGTTGIELTVADNSGDVVALKVEYDIQDDSPDVGFQLARPALLDPAAPTPELAITDVPASSVGTQIAFFWNTDFDLAELERDVRLRFTPTDGALVGPAFLSASLRVDNNEEPIVTIDTGFLVTNPDDRRGIPIPFSVHDDENDPVRVIFQWRRPGEPFPGLPADPGALAAILADPAQRRELRICTELLTPARGHVLPVAGDPSRVRLPELASSAAWILARGIEGRTLELLRSSSLPAPVATTWSENPLSRPVSAVPLGDGLAALVLDSSGGWRLREIELANGRVARAIAAGSGTPSALALESGNAAALVASTDAGLWRIERVELASGIIRELASGIASSEPAPVRALASLGAKACVLSVGSALLQVDYRDPAAPRLGTLLAGLSSPWGIAVDPLAANCIYLAERDAPSSSGIGRVLRVELGSRGILPVVVKTRTVPGAGPERPESLAVERDGARLLVLSGTGGVHQLVGIDLGAQGGNALFSIGPALSGGATSLAVGPDDLCILALPSRDDLAVAGGVVQRGAIATYDPASQTVVLTGALDPPARVADGWRISSGPPIRPRDGSASSSFAWDSRDMPGGGRVSFRALPLDSELGNPVSTTTTKSIRGALDVTPFSLGGSPTTDGPLSVDRGDLDGDGDLDLVSANVFASNLTVFFQLAPGSFAPTPLVLGGLPARTFGAASVAASDLDGDGDLDLVSANEDAPSSNPLTIFFQDAPGNFDPIPLALGGPGFSRPACVASGDLDGDGDLDLVAADQGSSSNLKVFFQDPPGTFEPIPLVLGGPGTTRNPDSVAAGDLDGDGDLDLVSANIGQSLTVFFQGAPGSFDAPPLVIGGFDFGTENPASVAATDLDGDGDLDLVSANRGPSSRNLTIFFQGAPGAFAPVPLVLGSPGARSAVFVAADDMDEDGDLDLVSANGSNNLAVFFQDAPGTFDSLPLVLGDSVTTSSPRAVALGDLDGDGHSDLVSANAFGKDLAVFLQSAQGSFAVSPTVLGNSDSTDAPFALVTGDLDGDGDLDLASANAGETRSVTVFYQSAPRALEAAPLVLDFGGSIEQISVAAGDLDGDGDLDLATNGSGGSPTIFFQGSTGTLEPDPLVLPPNRPDHVAVGDIDGDGASDLVTADAQTLRVYFQSSPRVFVLAPLVLDVPARPGFVGVQDLDRDGDLDLASANHGRSMALFFQTSPGNYDPVPEVLGFSDFDLGPRHLAAGDLDGDGDLDLVSAPGAGDNLAVYFQASPGMFDPLPLLLDDSTTNFPAAVALGDLDGDGRPDLVSANGTGDDLSIFFQGVPGTFDRAPLVLGGPSTTDTPGDVVLSDLDGDGDVDCVSANSDGDNLTVFWGGR